MSSVALSPLRGCVILRFPVVLHSIDLWRGNASFAVFCAFPFLALGRALSVVRGLAGAVALAVSRAVSPARGFPLALYAHSNGIVTGF